jgi:uracil-DNA glycosylase
MIRRMLPAIPPSWRPLLQDEVNKSYYQKLDAFLDQEVAAGRTILPAVPDIFNALRLTPCDQVKVLLVGQDPYPNPGDAHGLCFSVRPDVRPLPASLKNVFQELHDDVGFRIPNNGNLEQWARQGLLMLNTVLTVRSHEPNSHQKRGWETLTDRIIELVDARPTRVVFLLWGKPAQKKEAFIKGAHHRVVKCAHPSPLSAKKFLGSRCFSKVNELLAEGNLAPIDWQIPDV